MALTRLSRRSFLTTTATGAALGFAPRRLRAQPATFKLGVIHPVTGPLAEPGQACRLGAQMAADAINAAGGIKSLGGMKLELLLGDTQTKPDLGRLEAERVVNQGARMLMGSFDSGSTAAMVSVAQQKRVPFLVDIAAVTRPASAQLLLPEIRKQRVEVMGIVGPGSPGLYEAGQLAALKDDLEYVMDNVPSWPNFKKARTQAVAEEYRKRSGGKTFDTNSVASYDGMLTIADVLERAGREALADPDGPEAIVEAMKKTNVKDILAVAAGPVVFNEIGDNPNASTAMIQILGQKPVVVWPRDAAVQKFVFPRPKV